MYQSHLSKKYGVVFVFYVIFLPFNSSSAMLFHRLSVTACPSSGCHYSLLSLRIKHYGKIIT